MYLGDKYDQCRYWGSLKVLPEIWHYDLYLKYCLGTFKLMLNQTTYYFISCGLLLLVESQYEQNILCRVDFGWLPAQKKNKVNKIMG